MRPGLVVAGNITAAMRAAIDSASKIKSQLTNVASLEIAWTFSTGDLVRRADVMSRSAAESTPILAENSLIFCTPFNEIIAVDPGNGAEKWRFDPGINLDQRPANQFVCRGVSYWRDAAAQGSLLQPYFHGHQRRAP